MKRSYLNIKCKDRTLETVRKSNAYDVYNVLILTSNAYVNENFENYEWNYLLNLQKIYEIYVLTR